MTNWIISHVKSCKTCWGLIAFWGSILALYTGIAITACTIPHDFGNYNTLKTICHVWKGDDGFRYQDTAHINSSENTHRSHPWDYDGGCEE